MGVASLLWGIGIILWGKAINHIGLSLGFSIFIGTLILIGSLIPGSLTLQVDLGRTFQALMFYRPFYLA